MYYGLRSGHRPFNSPERFRGTTAAGEVGEMVAEVDDNIGQLFSQLEKYDFHDQKFNKVFDRNSYFLTKIVFSTEIYTHHFQV